MGLLTGAAGAAAVVAGIFAGILADRLDRWILMAACDLARMLLYGLIPLVWAVHPQVWLLYVILPLCAALGMIFQVGYVTVVPALSGPARITEANGLLYGASSTAAIAGPLLAGLVSAALGPAAAIAVDAFSFAFSAVGVLLIRRSLSVRTGPLSAVSGGRSRWLLRNASRDGHPGHRVTRPGTGTPDTAGEPDRESPGGRLLAGARFLWQQPVLRALTVLLTFFIFATEGLPDVLIYYIKHDLGRGDGVVGLVLAIAALGTVSARWWWPRCAAGWALGRAGSAPCLLCGVAVGGLGMSGSVPGVAGLAAVYLGCTSVAGICSMSLRQQITPDHLLGRVTAAFWTIHFSLGPRRRSPPDLGRRPFRRRSQPAWPAPQRASSSARAALATPIRQRAPEPVPAGA